jgi:hypothetical protein
MQPTGEQIKAIWLELDKPGPEKLQVALRKRGFESPSVKQLREGFYKFESSRQVFRPPPKYTGHIYATRIDNRWTADIMQLPAAKYDGKEWEYALMVVDIFLVLHGLLSSTRRCKLPRVIGRSWRRRRNTQACS